MNITCLLIGHIEYFKFMDKPKKLANNLYQDNIKALKHCLRCKQHIDSDGWSKKDLAHIGITI